jgi:hypothetical protein
MSEQRDNPAVVHEESDVNVRAILGFGGGLLVLAIMIQLFLWWLFNFYSSRAEETSRVYPLAAERQSQQPPEPRLQEHPQRDMRELRARDTAILNSYEWVNKEAGFARIPIEEAMRLVVERGLPAREKK